MDYSKLLKAHSFMLKKSLGQNFILDSNLLQGIVGDAEITKQDTVVEIGAGCGSLTAILAQSAERVISFEIDRRLEPILAQSIAPYNNVELIFEDFLKFSQQSLVDLVGNSYKVVANLPYYITTPIIFKLLENNPPKSITIMLQKEVAERICALPSTKDYGVLSVSVQALCEVEITRIVPRTAFLPPPNVDSAVIRMDVLHASRTPIFKKTVGAAFAMRRKTLVNNLCAAFDITREKALQIMDSLSLEPQARGETLSVPQFLALSELIEKAL